MEHRAHGGALLRSLRQERDCTQRDLGRASGVSVRTIRGVERGQIHRPQVATLQQLALALKLTPYEQAEFMHAWATPTNPGFDSLLVDPTLSEMEQIDAMTRSVLGAYRVISQNWHTTIGADRRMATTRCQTALEAVEDGLERVFNVQNGDAHAKASRLEFVPLRGSRLERRWDFEDSNVTVFGVGLPRPLAKGDFHSYEYKIICHPDEDSTGLSDGCIWGAPHTARSIVVSVEFAVAPSTVRQVRRAPGQGFEFLDEVALDGNLHAAIVLEDANPGAYGFSWEW